MNVYLLLTSAYDLIVKMLFTILSRSHILYAFSCVDFIINVE